MVVLVEVNSLKKQILIELQYFSKLSCHSDGASICSEASGQVQYCTVPGFYFCGCAFDTILTSHI